MTQVVAHSCQLGAAMKRVRCMRVAHPVRGRSTKLGGQARPGLVSSTTDAARRKKRRQTAHSRVVDIAPCSSTATRPTTGVSGRHRDGVVGRPLAARYRSSAPVAIGGNATRPRLTPLPTTASQWLRRRPSPSPPPVHPGLQCLPTTSSVEERAMSARPACGSSGHEARQLYAR